MPTNPKADQTVEIVSERADYKVQVVGDQVVDLTGATPGDVLVVQPDGSLAPAPVGVGGASGVSSVDGDTGAVVLSDAYAGTPGGAAATAVVTTGDQSVAGAKTLTGDVRAKSAGMVPFAAGGAGVALGPPPGTITLADGGAGSLAAGTYKYVMTEYDQFGQSTPGPEASITIGASRQIQVTVPITRRGMQARSLYRTAVGGSTHGLVHNFGGANGYFQTVWVDNRADGSRGAAPPVADTTQYWVFTTPDLPMFRLHPTLSADANDLALLTKKPGVSGSYAMDAYGTILVRDSAGNCFTAQHVGTSGNLFYGEYLPTTDASTGLENTATATEVFTVLAQGSVEMRPLKTDTSALTVIPRAALADGMAALHLETVAGTAGIGQEIVHRGTGIAFAVTHTGSAGNGIYVSLPSGNAATALNIIHSGTGSLIGTNKGFVVQTGGNLNCLGVATPNYLRLVSLQPQGIFETPLDVRGLAAGGHAVNLAEFMPNPTDGAKVTWAISPSGLPKWNHASSVQTTVGAAGAASALPATPSKFLKVVGDNGTTYVVPAYAAA